MKHSKAWLLAAVVACCAAAPSFAQTAGRGLMAPPGPDAAPATPDQIHKLLADMHAKLAAAPDAETAAKVAASIERLWAHAGTDTSAVLLERASTALAQSKNDLALKFLTVAVELQPDFAEAWNQRAYVYYATNQIERAVGDLRRVLALDPNHFKALEGLSNILREQGQKKAALTAMKKLLEVYPLAPGVKQAHDELVRDVEGQGI
jgi:tetratricopeptide (TPR) repeat protein